MTEQPKKYNPQEAFRLAQICELTRNHTDKIIYALKIRGKVLFILDISKPVILRRDTLYQNATNEVLEDMADRIWEKIIDRELEMNG